MLCLTIVAAFQLPLAAAAVSEDVPLPGGAAALAQALGIDPVPERGRLLYEVTRLLYNTPEGRRTSGEAFLLALRQSAARAARGIPQADTRPAETIPVPLTTDLWSNAIFRRKVAPRELINAILADRSAALLCLGLTALDDRTLAYLADRPSLLERIYERSATAFAAFSSSLRIEGNRVIPPGGIRPIDPSAVRESQGRADQGRGAEVSPSPRAAPRGEAAPMTGSVDGRAPQGDRDEVAALWEVVVAEKVTRPERFLTQLLELNEGRLAYLYDTIGQLDPPRRAFALGLWMDGPARVERFKALTVGIDAYREARLRTLPFGRASYDLSMTLMRIEAGDNGVPRPPALRGLWSRVFSGPELPDDGARLMRNADEDPIDAAWLISAIGSADVRQRAERLDQISFAQRVFGAADANERGDVLVALRALSRYRMLMWTLERMGVRTPAVFASAAKHAARLGPIEGRRGLEVQAQFQGALALVARMAAVRTLDPKAAQKLAEQIVAVPVNDSGEYAGAMARWLRDVLLKAIPRAATDELAVIAAMSGPPSGDGPVARRVTWEGQTYRLDLGAAERQRLQKVREKQEGPSLDVATELGVASRALASEKIDLDEAHEIATRLTALAADIPRRIGHDSADATPSGVAPAANAAEAVRRALDELTRHLRAKELKRAARMSDSLGQLADALLAQVLPSIAYAADVGDPDGTVLLAADVSRRHDFGFGAKDAEVRLRSPWAVPRPEVTPGVPWHVNGSLLGLDIALAPLALRRLNFERVLEAPKLTSNERDNFALSVSLLNPFNLRDAERDSIVEAVARGRQRVAALTSRATAASLADREAAFDRLADEILVEGWRRRAVRWMLSHEADRVAGMFSATELLALGGGRTADFDAWGMSMLTVQGCVCSRLTPPGRWPILLGRPPLGMTASALADLNLHVAIMLKELRLPAAIAKVVLAGAMQDFIDEAKPSDDADWLTLSRTARAFTRERIEDYISAATAGGPLVPDLGRSGAAEKEDDPFSAAAAGEMLPKRGRTPFPIVP